MLAMILLKVSDVLKWLHMDVNMWLMVHRAVSPIALSPGSDAA